jgi:hypothetical protein
MLMVHMYFPLLSLHLYCDVGKAPLSPNPEQSYRRVTHASVSLSEEPISIY